ncbi:MAG: hypothetical protein JXO72_08185 [Vicinamibacteria bacterium]|nr:hypothetical protein [Vicinamibacteria bacterium]
MRYVRLARAWPHNITVSLFVIVVAAHAYFWNAHGWNQTARFASILSFVEPGPGQFTFRIENVVRKGVRGLKTGDWTLYDGHYYSNKAPGLHLLGIPAYFPLFHLERLVGLKPFSATLTNVNKAVINVWCTVFWTALATSLLCRFLLARGVSATGSVFASAAYALGSLVFPFGTSLWGHATGAAFLLIASCMLFWPRRVRAPMLCGFMAGYAVMIEYSAALPLVCIALAAVATLDRRVLARLAIGASIPLAALLIYQKACFNGFLTTSVAATNPIFLNTGKLGGVLGLPSVYVFGMNLFSPYRGLLLFCPVLALALPGILVAWRDGRGTLVAACAGAIIVVHLLAASFNGWPAGWATGPRYLIVSIPFWCLMLPDIGRLRRMWRLVCLATATLSTINMTAIAAVEVMITDGDHNPLYGTVYRCLLSGRYPLRQQAHNAGRDLFGLPPLWDLLPLALLLAAWIAWIARQIEKRDARVRT